MWSYQQSSVLKYALHRKACKYGYATALDRRGSRGRPSVRICGQGTLPQLVPTVPGGTFTSWGQQVPDKRCVYDCLPIDSQVRHAVALDYLCSLG